MVCATCYTVGANALCKQNCARLYKSHVQLVTVAVQVLRIKHKKDLDDYTLEDLEIFGYNPHKKIAMKMAV